MQPQNDHQRNKVWCNFNQHPTTTKRSTKLQPQQRTLRSLCNGRLVSRHFDDNSLCSCESSFLSSLAPSCSPKFTSKSAFPKRRSRHTSRTSVKSARSFYSCTSFVTNTDQLSSAEDWPPPPLPPHTNFSPAPSDQSVSSTCSSSTPSPTAAAGSSPNQNDTDFSSSAASSCGYDSGTGSGFRHRSKLFDTTLLAAAENTHTQAQTIRKDRLFIVPARVRWYVEQKRIELGACVSYVGKCPHTWCALTLGNRCIRCDNDLCIHMYRCSCQQSGGGHDGGWCAHIHAATLRGRVLFGEQAMVYVHSSSAQKMRIRHLRALCHTFARPVIDANGYWQCVRLFEEQQGESGMRPYSPRPSYIECGCPPYKRCMACAVCYCSFKCECEEYRLFRFACEHVHIAAMSTQYRWLFRNQLSTVAGQKSHLTEAMADTSNIAECQTNDFATASQAENAVKHDTLWGGNVEAKLENQCQLNENMTTTTKEDHCDNLDVTYASLESDERILVDETREAVKLYISTCEPCARPSSVSSKHNATWETKVRLLLSPDWCPLLANNEVGLGATL